MIKHVAVMGLWSSLALVTFLTVIIPPGALASPSHYLHYHGTSAVRKAAAQLRVMRGAAESERELNVFKAKSLDVECGKCFFHNMNFSRLVRNINHSCPPFPVIYLVIGSISRSICGAFFNFLISSLGSHYITQDPLIRISPCGLQTFAVSAQWMIFLSWIMLAFSARRIRVN